MATWPTPRLRWQYVKRLASISFDELWTKHLGPVDSAFWDIVLDAGDERLLRDVLAKRRAKIRRTYQ